MGESSTILRQVTLSQSLPDDALSAMYGTAFLFKYKRRQGKSALLSRYKRWYRTANTVFDHNGPFLLHFPKSLAGGAIFFTKKSVRVKMPGYFCWRWHPLYAHVEDSIDMGSRYCVSMVITPFARAELGRNVGIYVGPRRWINRKGPRASMPWKRAYE